MEVLIYPKINKTIQFMQGSFTSTPITCVSRKRILTIYCFLFNFLVGPYVQYILLKMSLEI